MKYIKQLIRGFLYPVKTVTVKILKILLRELFENQDRIYNEIQNTQDLIICGINNSIFRIQEYEESYSDMRKLLEDNGIEFSLYAGALLSVVRNGYLDPNMLDIDYLVEKKFLDTIYNICVNHSNFRIHTQLFCEDLRMGYHIYDSKRNILHDFYSISTGAEMILTGDSPFATYTPEKNIDHWVASAYLPYNVYNHSEFFDGLEYIVCPNATTGNTISFKVMKSHLKCIYKLFGNNWAVRLNIHREYYADIKSSDEGRRERGALILQTEKNEHGYKNVHLLQDQFIVNAYHNYITAHSGSRA